MHCKFPVRLSQEPPKSIYLFADIKILKSSIFYILLHIIYIYIYIILCSLLFRTFLDYHFIMCDNDYCVSHRFQCIITIFVQHLYLMTLSYTSSYRNKNFEPTRGLVISPHANPIDFNDQ